MRDWRRQQIPQTPNVARLSPCHRHSGAGDGDDDCDGGGQKICYNCIIVLMKMTLSSPVQPHSLFWKFTQSFGGAEGGRVGQSRALAFLSKPTIVRMRMRRREEKRMMITLVKSGKLFSEPASSSKTLITTFPSLQSKGNRNHLWSWYRWWWCGALHTKANMIIKCVSAKCHTCSFLSFNFYFCQPPFILSLYLYFCQSWLTLSLSLSL